ncbi:hypothetical protein [Mycoplasma sp. 327]
MAKNLNKKRRNVLYTMAGSATLMTAGTWTYILLDSHLKNQLDLKQNYFYLKDILKKQSDSLYNDSSLKIEVQAFLKNAYFNKYTKQNQEKIALLINKVIAENKKDIEEIKNLADNIVSKSLKNIEKNKADEINSLEQKIYTKKEVVDFIKYENEIILLIKKVVLIDKNKAKEFYIELDKVANNEDLARLKSNILLYLAKRGERGTFEKIKEDLIKEITKNSNFSSEEKADLINKIKDTKSLNYIELIKQKIATLDTLSALSYGLERNNLVKKAKDSTTIEQLNDINKKIEKIFNDKKKKLLDLVSKLIVTRTKNYFYNKQNKAINQNEIEALIKTVENEIFFEKVFNTFDRAKKINKNEAQFLLSRVSDQYIKKMYGALLKSDNFDLKQITDIKDKFFQALEFENKADFIKIINSSLIQKINDSSILSPMIEELVNKVNNLDNKNLDEVMVEVNDTIALSILQAEAKDLIKKLNISNFKTAIEQKLNTEIHNPSQIFDVINQINTYIKDFKDRVQHKADKIENSTTRDKFNSELIKAETENEIKKIEKDIDALLANTEDLRKVASEIVMRLAQSDKKSNFESIIANKSSTENDLHNIITEAQSILEKAKNEALMNVSKSYNSSQYHVFKEKINAENTTQDEYKNIEIEALKLFNDMKKHLINELGSLSFSMQLSDLINDEINEAANIYQLNVILEKIKAYLINNKIKDVGQREKQNDLVKKINKALDIALDEIKKIIVDSELIIALEAGDEIEIIKSEINRLPYPSGKDAPAIKEMINEINNIENDSTLGQNQKLEKIKNIASIINSLADKINRYKDDIKKVNPQKQARLNNKLDNSNFLPPNNNEFDELKRIIQDAKNEDKNEAIAEIEKLNLLTSDQSKEFKEKINDSTFKTYDEIQKVVINAKLQNQKNKLINEVKKFEYPHKDKAPAVLEIISQIEALQDLQQVINYQSIIEKIKRNIAIVNTKLSNLLVISNEIKEKFDEANTDEEFDNLNTLVQNALDNQSNKLALDNKVESLPYPKSDGVFNIGSNDAPAISKIKSYYTDSNGVGISEKITEIDNKIINITINIESSKQAINKISKKNQLELWSKLRDSYTDQEFNELIKKIANAHASDVVEAKAEITKLTNLSQELVSAFNARIEANDDYENIKKIVNEARLKDKKEEIKKLISMSDYVNDSNSDVSIKNNFNTTKAQFDNVIDQIVIDDNSYNQIKEQTKDFVAELHKARDLIDSLSLQDVIDVNNVKFELKKLITTIINKSDLEKVEVEIAKYKLKKQILELDYYKDTPQPAPATIILNSKIDLAKNSNEIEVLENLIKSIPEKIKKAKEAIDSLDKSPLKNNIAQRKQALKEELNRSVDGNNFDLLLKNINAAKNENESQYRQSRKQNLIEKAKGLEYPSVKSEQSEAITSIIKKIEVDFSTMSNDTNLLSNKWARELEEIEKNIFNSKGILEKINPKHLDNLNIEFNKADESNKFEIFNKKINQALQEDKQEIIQKIKALSNLDKTTKSSELIKKLDNKSYNEMVAVLNEAYKIDLIAKIDKLPYPLSNAKAKIILKSQLNNIINENSYYLKLKELSELEVAINNAKNRINSLSYPMEPSLAKKKLNDKLDESINKDQINKLANNDLKSKIEKYKELIEGIKYPISVENQAKLLDELSSLTNEQEEEFLKLNIYNAKRETAHKLIDGLTDLDNLVKENKKQEITQKISGNSLDLQQELTDINEKIFEAQKQNSKQKIQKIPYPINDVTSQNSRNLFNTKIDSVQSEEGLYPINNILDLLKNEITTINNEVSLIVDAFRKDKINKLINGVTDIKNLENIRLELLRAKAADVIDNLVDLSTKQKEDYKSEIDKKTNDIGINLVVESAKLQNKKEETFKLIDRVSYPKKNNDFVAKSIKKNKDEVQALNNNSEVTIKKQEIQIFDTKLKELIELAKTIEYSESNSHALVKILEGFDSATSVAELEQILPKSWPQHIKTLKKLAEKYFGINSYFVTNKLSHTYPQKNASDSEGLSLQEFCQLLITEFKKQAKIKIDSLLVADEGKKQQLHKQINDILVDGIIFAIDQDIFEKPHQIINKAIADDAIEFIQNLAYPQDSNSAQSKATIKTQLVDSFKINQVILVNEEVTILHDKLKKYKEQVDDLNSLINLITDITKKMFYNDLFSRADNLEKLKELKNKIKWYVELQRDILSIIDLEKNEFDISYGSKAEDVLDVNQNIVGLREKLLNYTFSANNQSEIMQLKSIVSEVKAAYDKLKMLFVKRDTLMMSVFLKQIKEAIGVGSIETIMNNATEVKNKMDVFWKKTSPYIGFYIFDHRDKLLENAVKPDNERIIDGTKFKTFDEFIKHIRTQTNPNELQSIIEQVVPLYHGVIDYLLIAKDNLTQAAHKYYRDEILKATTKQQIELQVNDAKIFNEKVLESRNKLAQIGKVGNRAKLMMEIENANNASNIQNVLNKIEQFRNQFSNATLKLNEYKSLNEKEEIKLRDFETRLDKLQEADTSSQLANEIEVEIARAKAIAQVKQLIFLNINQQNKYIILLRQAGINYLNYHGEITRITNEAKQFNEKVKTAKDILSLFAKDSNKTTFNKTISNALDIQTMQNIIVQINDFKIKYDESRKLVEAYKNLNNKDATRFDQYNKKLDAIQDGDEANSLINEIKSEFKSKLKLIINNIPYPNKNSSEAQHSINVLSVGVDNLNTIDQFINKAIELSELNDEISKKAPQVDLLQYSENNAFAKQAIKTELNKATTILQVKTAFPDDWSQKVAYYKQVLEKYFEAQNKTNLAARFNRTHPKSSDHTVSELEKQLLLTMKVLAKNHINTFKHLGDSKKVFIERIDAINGFPDENRMQQVALIYIEAVKANYNNFIDKLALPNDNHNQANSLNSKNNLKNILVNSFTKISTKINNHQEVQALESELNNLNELVNNIKTKIQNIDVETKTSVWNEEFSKSDTSEKLRLLLAKINKFDQVLEKINRITDLQSSDVGSGNELVHSQQVNEELSKLRESYKDKLGITKENDIDKLNQFVEKANEVVRLLKDSFKTDLLVEKAYIKKIASAGDAAQLEEIRNDLREYKRELTRFWSSSENLEKYIRDNKSLLSKNVLNGIKRYEELVNDARTFNSAAELKKFNDYTIPLYHGYIDYLIIDKSGIPKSVLNIFNQRVQLAPDKNTIENVIIPELRSYQRKLSDLKTMISKLKSNDSKSKYNGMLDDADSLTKLENIISNARKELIVQRVETRLKQLKTSNSDPEKNKKQILNAPEEQYIKEFKQKIERASNVQQEEQIEREFIFSRYYESKRLYSVLNSLEFIGEILISKAKKSLNPKYINLINKFKEKDFIKGFKNNGETKYQNNYTYTESNSSDRTLAQFAHMWVQISNDQTGYFNQQDTKDIFSAATQWKPNLYNDSYVQNHKWNQFPLDNYYNLIDQAISLAKKDKKLTSIEDLYATVDTIAGFGFAKFKENPSKDGIFSVAALLDNARTHQEVKGNEYLVDAFVGGATTYDYFRRQNKNSNLLTHYDLGWKI